MTEEWVLKLVGRLDRQEMHGLLEDVPTHVVLVARGYLIGYDSALLDSVQEEPRFYDWHSHPDVRRHRHRIEGEDDTLHVGVARLSSWDQSLPCSRCGMPVEGVTLLLCEECRRRESEASSG